MSINVPCEVSTFHQVHSISARFIAPQEFINEKLNIVLSITRTSKQTYCILACGILSIVCLIMDDEKKLSPICQSCFANFFNSKFHQTILSLKVFF